jgi:predicted ATPase
MLEARFDDLLFEGRKQIMAIMGNARVGKSRLIAEWRKRAIPMEGAEVIWLTGRGHTFGQQTYGVFNEIFAQYLAFEKGDTQAVRWRKLFDRVRDTFSTASTGWAEHFLNRLAYLGHFLNLDLSTQPGLPERIMHLGAEALDIQVRLAICALLTHMAHEHPLVLVLEDLQWADEASLDLLTFIVEHVGDDTPLLCCLVFHPRSGYPVSMTWDAIKRVHPDCYALALEELPPDEGRQLLGNLMSGAPLPQEFQDLLLNATDGNPLYLEEVLHTLIEDEILVHDAEAGWQLVQQVTHITVPDTLYQIIQSRIDELDISSPGAGRGAGTVAVAAGSACGGARAVGEGASAY